MRARDGKCQQPSLLPSPRFSRVFSHPVSCYAFEIVMVFLLTFSPYIPRVRLWLCAVSQSLASIRQISLFNLPLKRSCKLETVVANSRSPPLEPFLSSSLPLSLLPLWFSWEPWDPFVFSRPREESRHALALLTFEVCPSRPREEGKSLISAISPSSTPPPAGRTVHLATDSANA